MENGGYSSRNTCRTHLRKTDGPQTFEREGLACTQAKLEREKRAGTDLAAVEHVRRSSSCRVNFPRHPRAAGLQLRLPRSTSKLIGIQSGKRIYKDSLGTLEDLAG